MVEFIVQGHFIWSRSVWLWTPSLKLFVCAASCHVVIFVRCYWEAWKKKGKGGREQIKETYRDSRVRGASDHSGCSEVPWRPVSLSTLELAITNHACTQWRAKALHKCKCHIGKVTLRGKVSWRAEPSRDSAYHWFIFNFRQIINPTPTPVHTQYGLALITWGKAI